ncbi:MAG: cytochrome c biogenesis protein CcdA [Spirochaetaceae bacterium]|jgi:cytochrome c-type biogenesis protein|nr:cytochrome c biogenesis protein CcdA [Spirochaetaceae bacterium]
MNTELSGILAFGAGLLSFLSPCVLPLIPSWLCLIGGISIDRGAFSAEHESRLAKNRLLIATLVFVLGFSTVFTVMSLIVSRAFLLLSSKQTIINGIAGACIVLMGLHILFDLFAFLNYEKRAHLSSRPQTLLGCFITGAAFATGWTPCIGPLLSSILFLAAQEGEGARALLYLASYSLGLGLPFILAALFIQTFLKRLSALMRILPLIQKLSGVFLILLGIGVMSGSFRSFSARIIRYSGNLVQILSTESLVLRIIPACLYLLCAGIPLIRLLRKRKIFSLSAALVCSGFIALFVLQITGLLNTAGMIAELVLFLQSF